MQYSFSCLPQTLELIEASLSPARLARYLPAAGGDKQVAVRLYLWNARLCEAMYLPLQLAEVLARNAVAGRVRERFGSRWYEHSGFEARLRPHMLQQLRMAVAVERASKGLSLNEGHVISALSLGFWNILMSAPYSRDFWARGVQQAFPNAPMSECRERIHKRIEDLRLFRNRIAHHNAIFDKWPQREYQNALKLTEFVCKETAWLSQQVSRVNTTINERPSA